MRHLAGFVLAIVLAVAIFFGATWGYLRLLRVPVVNGAAATLPAAGGSLLHDSGTCCSLSPRWPASRLLAGICVAVPRISPLAAGLPGLGLLAWTVLYLVNVGRAVRYIPLKADAFGDGFEAMLINGVLAAAGLAMIVPLFIPSRWRRTALPVYAEPGEDLTTQPGTGSSVLLTSDWGQPDGADPAAAGRPAARPVVVTAGPGHPAEAGPGSALSGTGRSRSNPRARGSPRSA